MTQQEGPPTPDPSPPRARARGGRGEAEQKLGRGEAAQNSGRGAAQNFLGGATGPLHYGDSNTKTVGDKIKQRSKLIDDHTGVQDDALGVGGHVDRAPQSEEALS